MRSLKSIFFAAAFLAAFSCSKSEGDSPSPSPTPTPVDNTTSITVQAPVLSDGTKMKWKKGDALVVCEQVKDATLYRMIAQSDGESTIFKGVIPKTMTSFKAFFPAGNVKASSGTTNFTFVWNGQQAGSAGEVLSSVIPMVYYGDNVKSGFTFRPVASALKITLSGSDIASVKLEVGASDTDYVGADIIAVNTSTLNTSTTSATSITRTLTMTPSSGTVLGSGDFYFGLLSKSTSRAISGYTLTYTKTDGSVITRKGSDVMSIVSGGVIAISGDENTQLQTSSKVSGRVTDAGSGAGIAGVGVSDGIQIVKTDANGSYSFTSDLTTAQNVFVIMPSEYEFSFDQYGVWSNHKMLDTGKKEQTVDFALTKRTSSSDKFRILLLGDPQQMSSRAHSSESWTYVCNAINAYRTSVSVPLYQISMGDMVTNEIEVAGMAEAFLATLKTSGVGTFSVPGNHDHVQKASTYYASVVEFSRWFGPYNYSFNLGKQHFIFLDSCAWCEGSGTYLERLNLQGITFLENDLALVDVNTPVHIFTHCPLTKKQNGGFPSSSLLYMDRMFKALSGRNVDMWYGHIHINVNYSYTASELSSKAPGVKSLNSHLVSRCGGNWGGSSDICCDGTPRGFVELDIDGTSSHWQFHSIVSGIGHTMNAYVPGQFAGESLTKYDESALYCNIYMWDNAWGTPEVWSGGQKLSSMTRVVQGNDAAYDPLYQHTYPSVKERGLPFDDSPSTSHNMHLFKYTPGSGVKNVEIRVKDRWGDEQKMETKW